MILLTAFYADPDPNRCGELLECLKRNLEHTQFEEVHVFVEDASAHELLHRWFAAAPKLRLLQQGRRATYRDLFAHANTLPRGRIVIIANADIFFDESLARLNGHELSGRLLCLSRWDVRPDGSVAFFDHSASQDAWIFQTPIRKFPCDFHLGVPGCDNRLAWEAGHAGLQVSNPGRSVRANHLHLSGVRRYSERQRLAGPTSVVPASFLEPPRRAPESHCAAVRFSEHMGYTIAKLQPGISSHNNDFRPFTVIPESLAGLEFTQVVSMSMSPVEVEFLTAGKLYVLVGTDWEGYYPATGWLSEFGFKEDLPPVETSRGTAFEAWSLIGEAGQIFTLPTQVMLAAGHLVAKSARESARRESAEVMFALTSLPPAPDRVQLVRDCLDSWRQAGLQVRSFNHPSEIARLAPLYDVEFVPVETTTIDIFGRHFVPIRFMLDWAVKADAPVLLINADIRLQLDSWELKRLRWLSDGGLCYFVRHNHDGNPMRAEREFYGIDAFLLHGRDVSDLPDSFLSMGQPAWDYWLPHAFAARNRPIYGVEFPAAFHQRHHLRWSWENWRRCAIEFARITGEPIADESYQACTAMFLRVRENFERRKISPPPSPFEIRDWVRRTFACPGPKVFLELGSHRGDDTAWMSEIPNVTIYAFEPDPRNQQPGRPNVTLRRAAIADRDGCGHLILSRLGWGQEWTHSSSIKRPKNHLRRYPVTFGEAVEVDFITLDTFCREHRLGRIDFIWADIQGAEADMIRGGQHTLSRTRYLYTEYSDDELYEGQVTLKGMLDMLPDFRVIELWPDEVLLENRRLLD
jgi:FkbM family methyltransferase